MADFGCFGAMILLMIVAASILLKISCWLFNKIAGANSAVPRPPLQKAMGIVIVTAVAQSIATYLLGKALGSAAAISLPSLPLPLQIIGVLFVPLLLSFLLGLIVQAWMLQLMLPTSFGRGFGVSVVQVVIVFLFFSAAFGALYMGLSMMGFGPRSM